MRRLISLALAVPALGAGVALADGPAGSGTAHSVRSPDGSMLYTASPSTSARHTRISMWRKTRLIRTVKIAGDYGMPVPTAKVAEGVSHDGGTLVLGRLSRFGGFAILDGRTLRVQRRIELAGMFTYDALSPNGRTLFLIQHRRAGPGDRYSVRAYDVKRGQLLKQVVFDRREESSLMSGFPVTRATGPSGRWVYTLYTHPNGSLFVHALDSVDRHAYCIDLPRRVSPSSAWRVRLELTPGTLAVINGTKRLAAIDTRRLRVR